MKIIKSLNLLLVLFAAYACLASFSVCASEKKTNQISYTDVGSGMPIILIHAFPTDQDLWKAQREG